MHCPSCNVVNDDSAKFCVECGHDLGLHCPDCGSEHRPGDRFCASCGARLTGDEAEEHPTAAAVREKRLVSVVFVDLVSFTSLAESRDDEEISELLERYFEMARTAISRYGGTLSKFAGDGVMAVWGAPRAREDDAERAVRAALEVVGAVAAIGQERGVPNLQARAGVVTGQAVSGFDPEEGLVLGDKVNTAARAEGVAACLHRVLGEPDVAEAVALAREACAGLSAAGRPIYAAWSAMPWPEDPLMQLWHAGLLLREHRGGGHVAALMAAGLDPVEALVTGGLASDSLEFVRTTRGWTDAEWTAGVERLRARGLVDDGGLTAAGVALRQQVEATTDALAMSGWAHLGAEGCARLVELLAPLRERLFASGVLPDWIRSRG